MNKENFIKVLEQIKQQPETWKQDTWHCGTQHCFAGWAQILSGQPIDDQRVRRDARMWLDLSLVEANYAFASYRTMQDFENFLDGYNQVGYNQDGYDRDGYNQVGYNQDGYDRDGYSRVGYNQDGYDRDGYNWAGYNQDGYDRDGLDRNNKPKKTHDPL